jgi:hypothetical protein
MKLSNTKIGQFIEAYQQGVDAWVKAGEILVEMVEEDFKVFEKIVEKCPAINVGALYMFEQMGRKTLHPRLLLSDSPGYQKLAALPLSLQERYLDEPLPLVVETDNGTDILLVKTREMTTGQARQVFGNGRIRTEGEQKAWLIDRASKAAKPVGSNISAWKIKAGRVEFQAGATLSAGELATIITQLTR